MERTGTSRSCPSGPVHKVREPGAYKEAERQRAGRLSRIVPAHATVPTGTGGMNWTCFNTHGDSPERAFEALTGCLFERWCQEEYGDQLEQVAFVNGAGGDGGVEAYVTLRGGAMVGLQAKYFREPLDANRLDQVRKSFNTAVQVRPQLIRYIIALPRDLGDKKADKRVRTTERQRWDDFVTDQGKGHPGLGIELWDESRLTQLLAAPRNEGLTRYWFDRTVINLENLRLTFDRQKSGWLSRRYFPDLHQMGEIEKDAAVRLEGPAVVPEMQREVQNLLGLLGRARGEVERLLTRPELRPRENMEDRLRDALASLDAALIQTEALQHAIQPGNAFPLPPREYESVPLTAAWELLEELKSQKPKGIGLSPTEEVERSLDCLWTHWNQRQTVSGNLDRFGRHPMYVAEAGAGKTHALARLVEAQLQKGAPALLIRALDLKPREGWESVLRKAADEPAWTLPQILDALEASAAQVDVRRAAQMQPAKVQARTRVLIAVDGLDETPRSTDWADRLGELNPLIRRFPRILFAFSLRPSLSARLPDTDSINRVWLQGSDPDVPEVFAVYCRASGIEAPPALRWALRTPLAVRLFAELYKGQSLARLSLDEVSLVSLMHKKLNYVEQAIRELDPDGWPDFLSPVRHSLRALARECLRQGRPLFTEEALQAAASHLRPVGMFSPEKLLRILEQCRDRGLLLVQSESFDGSPDDEWSWEPAYQVLMDYLLAEEACQLALEALEAANMPDYLQQRFEAQVMTVSLLEAERHRFYDSKLWESSLSPDQRERLQLFAIPMLPRERALEYRDFVAKIFTRSMPSCRQVLDTVVVPGLRVPGWPFGAQFVHEMLLPFRVADRDLFWSGPRYLPDNHGGVWEGFGINILEKLEIAEDDPWDAAPLLLAWATTTVDNRNRRRIRMELAQWGSKQPEGLLLLLATATETNDPQMKEDLLSAAYGAACLTRPSTAWKPLCEWVIDRFFVPGAPLRTNNVVVRHTAKGLVERAVACGVQLEPQRLDALRQSLVRDQELLSIDLEAVQHIEDHGGHHGARPATDDLAWYVVPSAIDPFFDRMKRTWTEDQEPSNNTPTLEDVSGFVLWPFVAGELRKGAKPAARKAAEAVLEEQLRIQVEVIARQSEDQRMIEELIALMEATIPGPDSEQTPDETAAAPTQEHAGAAMAMYKSPELPSAAKALLALYADAYGLEALTERQLAFGYVTAYARSLGWDYERFLGDPRGGEPGEVLGPDVAILRQHHPASHGSRSSVMTFAEKYVWLAVHDLTGYLADRLAVRVDDNVIDPPVEPSLLAEATNPATDVALAMSAPTWEGFFPPQLIPCIPLRGSTQVECANEWAEKAPLPEMDPLLFPETSLLPSWAQEHEWIVLNAFVHLRESHSQAKVELWVSCALFAQELSSVLAEDAESKAFFEELTRLEARIERATSYVDVHEALWAPWLRDSYGFWRHKTLDEQGHPVFLDLRAATCSLYWDSSEGETEIKIPAEPLRRALRLVDLQSGRYIDSGGETLAFSHKSSTEGWWTPPFSQTLLVRRDAFEAALQDAGLAPCWAVRLYREPSVPLLQEGWTRTRFDWSTLSLFVDGALRTFELNRSVETFTPEPRTRPSQAPPP